MAFKSGMLLTLVVLVAAAAADMVDVQPVNCTRNVKNRRTVAKLRVNSQQECSRYCDKVDNCLSYQVQTEQRQCALLKRRVGPKTHHMVPKTGWTYKEKVDIYSPMSDSCKETPPQCRASLKTFDHVEVIAERGATWAWWGRDFAKTEEEDPRYFWMNGYSNDKTLYWYETLGSAWADKYRHNFASLPHGCDGLSHLVYDGNFWCRQHNTRDIVVFNLDQWVEVARIVINDIDGHVAGYNGQCYYDHGNRRTDMDIRVDETGLYIVWSRVNENCEMSVSKIDLETYTVERTWHVDYPRKNHGGTFLICGRLFGINHYNNNPAYILYAYDLGTHNFSQWFSNYNREFLYFPNEHGYLSDVSYNPTDGYLYVYNNIRWGRKKPVFDDVSYEQDKWQLIAP